jgi:uncharacterized protein (TIGR04255 family)
LPDFKLPPIDEVVLSIQFATLQGFKSVHAGLFWKSIRSKYPNVAEHPPLQSVFETFGTPPSLPGARIQLMVTPPTPRFWFEKEGKPDLLQLQLDRIVHNWRKREREQVYPRYEAIRGRFEAEVATFAKFLATERLGELRPNQCEVTYINLIELPDGEDPQPKLHEITPLWLGPPSTSFPSEFENALIQSQFLLKESGDESPVGRIYVNFQPAVRQTDLTPVVRLEITARAKPRQESITDAFRLLDHERSAVVQTFAAVTTSEMHKIWGRTDASR